MTPFLKEALFLGIPALIRFIRDSARQRRLDREARADSELKERVERIERRQLEVQEQMRRKQQRAAEARREASERCRF